MAKERWDGLPLYINLVDLNGRDELLDICVVSVVVMWRRQYQRHPRARDAARSVAIEVHAAVINSN